MKWWRKNSRDDDLDRELRTDLELEAEEQTEGGLSAKEAHYAALRAFGNLSLIKEQTRETWGWTWIERLQQDLHYAVRGLFRNPLFTLVAVLSVALGVGVTTGIFGALETLFLNAVTANNVDQLRHIEPGDTDVSYPYFQYLTSAKNAAIHDMIAFSNSNLSFRSGNNLQSVAGDIVSANFFDVLGVTPAMGRGFSAEEQQPGRQTQVVVISHSFWKRKLGARQDALGKVIELNGEPFTVIGVLAKDYRSVHGYGMAPEVYVPLSNQLLANLDDPGSGRLQLIARIQDGVRVSRLKASLRLLVQDWRRLYPADTRYSGAIEVYPVAGIEKMQRDGVPVELTVFLALLVLVAVLILLIACANVAGLLVARGVNRRGEIAVRVALGAARYRLIQQLLTESALLAFLGAGAGIVLYLLIAGAVANLQVRASMPFELHLHLDRPLLYFSIALVALTTLLSGLVPAIQSSRDSQYFGSNRIGAEPHQRYSFRQTLVMGQFAFAFVLLVAATLFLRSLAKGSQVDPGFDVQHLLTADVGLNPNSYPPARSEQYFTKAIAEIGRLPGVRSVAGATVVPLGMEHWVVSLKAGDHIVQRVFANSVTSGYFRTMRIPLLQGRDFEDGDRGEGAQVAIVNQTLAKRYFKGNALDHLVYMPKRGPKPTFSPVKVIGVVSDSKYGSLGEERMPALYLPISQQNGMLTLEVSTNAEPANILSAVGQTIASLDPHTPIKIELMQDRLAGALLPSKIASLLLTSIGVLGLLLATIGIYGMVAYSVARRTNEIGIRMALGATKADVLRMILRDATNLVFVGVAVGSILSIFIVQALRSIVPAGIHVVDPLSFAMVGCVLTIVALIAALIPAWKGARIDPTVALRYE